MSNIDYLPIWKKGAPAHERLYELAEIARKHPERFQKWIIVYCEDNEERFKTRWINGEETRTSDCLGILQAAIQTVFEETKK